MPGIAVSRPIPVRNAPHVTGRQQYTIRSIKIAVGVMALTWIPLAILSWMQGRESLRGFGGDYAAQSRLLVVIAVLIIAEPALIKRLDLISTNFLKERLISEADRPRFESVLAKFRLKSTSIVPQIGLLAIAWLIVVSALPYVDRTTFLPWCYGRGGIESLSPAGSWYLLVSFPIIIYLFLRWIWRQLVWGLFLSSITGMNLQTIPAHPDKVAGLGFVETLHREYVPFSFAVGTTVAGGVANRVLHGQRPLHEYEVVPVFVIVIVIAICAAPLCVFFKPLMEAKRRGIFEYGALANAVGRQFERKWLVENKEREEALEVQDFSATIDLYSVVANVQQMQMFPFDTGSIARLAIWSLIPSIPVVLASFGFEAVMKQLIKMLV